MSWFVGMCGVLQVIGSSGFNDLINAEGVVAGVVRLLLNMRKDYKSALKMSFQTRFHKYKSSSFWSVNFSNLISDTATGLATVASALADLLAGTVQEYK